MQQTDLEAREGRVEKKVRLHPSAWVDRGAKIGDGTVIWQNCNILDGARIGKDCTLGANVFVEGGVRLGNRVKVKNNIALYSGVSCEDDVFLGPGCVFTNVTNPRSFINRKQEFKTTLVKEGATVGANAVILCGHTIGKYAMVGAGAVVTRDVHDYELVVGNPARHMGYVCRCGVRLEAENGLLACPECHSVYASGDGILWILEEKQ